MSNQKYRISQRALEDLSTIWHYTFETWSKEQADRYHQLITDEIQYVSNNYSILRSIDYIRKGYRVSKVKSHLIFCKKDAEGVIEIVRVLHQRMDIKNRLGLSQNTFFRS